MGRKQLDASPVLLVRMRPSIPLALEAAAARAAGSLSRLAGQGGGTTLPGKLLWKLDPGRDRPPRGAAATGLRADLGDERQDDDRRDGGRDPAPACPPRAQQLGCEPRQRASPPPCSARAAPSSACSRSTRRRCPELARRLRPKALLLCNLFRDQLDRYGELELVAARWRDAVAALPDAQLVVNGDDPQVGDLGRDRANSLTFGLDDPRHARHELQHAADSKYCLRCGTPYDYAAAYVGHLGDYRCPNCGHARPPLDIVAREIELHGLDGSAFTLVTPAGEVAGRARAARALQRLQRARRSVAGARARASRRTRSSPGSDVSRPRSGGSSGSRSATGAS